MTAFENEIEWITDTADIQDQLKAAIWEDHTFKDFVAEHGLEDTLYEVMTFKRSVADNLRALSQLPPESRGKHGGAVRLNSRLKSRRTQLRAALKGVYGDEEGYEIIQRVSDLVDEESAD